MYRNVKMIVEDHDDVDDAVRWVYACSLITKRNILVTHAHTHTLLSPIYVVERIMFQLNSFPHTTLRTVNSQNPSDAVSTA